MRYEQSDGQSIETSRSVPQQTAQIFSPLAGQNRSAFRFSQIGQDTEAPHSGGTNQQNTLQPKKTQKGCPETSGFSWGQRWRGRSLWRLASFALLDGLPEEVFDLAVDAAQIVLRPGFEFRPERRIDSQ
jgi:hypothetical protein